MVGMEPTKNLDEGFREVQALVNISQSSIKLFGENADAVTVSMPSKLSTGGCEIKEVARIHEV